MKKQKELITFPTIRKFYTFRQYVEALQKFAFKHAVEVFAKLPEQEIKRVKHEASKYSMEWFSDESQEFLVKAKGPELSEVVAYPYAFSFRLRTVSVRYKNYGEPGHWDFVVEEKIYSDSPHNSKLQYSGASATEKKKQIELINAFADKLMEGIVPQPRFNLAKYQAAQEAKKTVAS